MYAQHRVRHLAPPGERIQGSNTIPQICNHVPQSSFTTRLNFDIHHQLLPSKRSISQITVQPTTNTKAGGQLQIRISQGYFFHLACDRSFVASPRRSGLQKLRRTTFVSLVSIVTKITAGWASSGKLCRPLTEGPYQSRKQLSGERKPPTKA